jgi:hypothetical protein
MALAALWVGGFTIAGLTTEKHVYVTYSVPSYNGSAALKENGGCSDEGLNDVWGHSGSTANGTGVTVSLCFEAADGFSNGKRLIPYKFDPATKQVWGADRWSSEVKDYVKKYTANFKIPASDYAELDRKAKSRWWTQIKEGFGSMMIGLVVLFIIVHAIGWVVRGFMGIPKGMDSKP